MLKFFREPVNSLTHWVGALLALAGLIALLVVGWGTPAKVISLLIYGVSLIFLFSASATYHMVQVKDKVLEIFRKVDHAAIYCLIAGTYTPFTLGALRGPLGVACASGERVGRQPAATDLHAEAVLESLAQRGLPHGSPLDTHTRPCTWRVSQRVCQSETL